MPDIVEIWFTGITGLGPTRLSLVDPAGDKLLNTVKVVGPAFIGDPADSFRLPYFVQNAYYYVPNANSKREGKPRILQLRDPNGDGVGAEFALFMYIACGALNTSVLGFTQKSDLAVQYPVELIVGNRTPEVQLWVYQVFAQQPIRPGRWSFTWRPGHGSEEIIHDEPRGSVLFRRFRHPLDLSAQGRDVIRRRVPDLAKVNAEILMDEDVPRGYYI